MDLVNIVNGVSKSVSFGKNFLFSRPFNISLDVTNSCNLACRGCDFPLRSKQKSERDPSLQTIVERVESMYRALGSTCVTLADFEPTMREDLAEVIRIVSQHNYVGIITNGTLINEELAEGYWGAGLSFASVSIPSFDDRRFKEIIRTSLYNLEDVKRAIEIFMRTSSRFGRVIIAATIDDKTTLDELYQLGEYAKNNRVGLSFQLYSPSKTSSVNSKPIGNDERIITVETIKTMFGGSLSRVIKDLKRRYPVIGRDLALDNFNIFIREGVIPFKPRSLKIYINGDMALYPGGEVFSNISDRLPIQVWEDYREYVEELRRKGPFLANNCYRCTNLTNPSTPIGDVLGNIQRSLINLIS